MFYGYVTTIDNDVIPPEFIKYHVSNIIAEVISKLYS